MSSKNFIVKNGISIGENEIVSANGDMFLHGNLKFDGHTIINTSGDLIVPGNLIIGTTTVQANVSNHANSAFDKANTADQRAVTSGTYANSAYNAANTADQRAVTSGTYANSAYNAANTADQRAVTSGVYANAAYGQANTATTNAATADQKAVSAGVYANSSFGIANTANQRAVTSGVYANSSFGIANTANQRAVTSGVYANSAYSQANTATTNAATADQRAVTSGVYANSAFASANTKSPLAGSSSVTTTGTVTSGTWSASFGAVSGANLTSLAAGNLSGTIPSGVLGNSVHFVGTTSIALNRGSASQTLTGVSIDGNAATATTADQIDSWVFRNTGSNAGINADTLDSNGITYYTAGVTNFSGNATDGALYSQFYSANWQHQIAGDYRSGQIALRGKNNGTWQAWRTVLDSSNYNSYAPTLTGGGASGTWGISVTGSAASSTTAVTLTSNQSSWGTGVIGNVVGLLAWKNYGNGHVIFDASQGTTPSGGACNNTNPGVAWSGTYPTLMGWNGTSTYGVRVDRANLADSIVSQTNSATITASVSTVGSTIVLRDGNGYIFNNYFNSTDNSIASGVTAIIAKQGDNYFRSATAAAVASFISGQSMNISGSASSNLLLSGGTMSGVIATVGNTAGFTGANDTTLSVRSSGTGTAASMSFHRPGAYAINLGVDTDNIFKLGGWSAGGVQHYWDNSGNAFATGSMRAPIFYDLNNTSFYVDPASNSNINTLNNRATNNLMFYEGFTLNADTMSTNATGFTYAVNAPYVGPIMRFGAGAYDTQFNTTYGGVRLAYRNRNGDNGAWYGWSVVTTYDSNPGGDLYANRFYDAQNSGFYCDPNSTSNLNVVELNTNTGSGNWPQRITHPDRGIYFINTTGSAIPCYFTVNSGGTLSGYIVSSGGTTQYLTSSDYRMKENVQDLDKDAALAKIMAVKSVTFNWLETHGGKADLGFIAHELQEVAPECVGGEKDALMPDGKIMPQGVDTSFLMPTLCAAIQKQQELIEQLMAKVAALEGI